MNGLNIKIDIAQKVYELWYSSFAKFLPWRLFWQKNSFITHILFELCLFWYLAHSQILGNSLYLVHAQLVACPLIILFQFPSLVFTMPGKFQLLRRTLVMKNRTPILWPKTFFNNGEKILNSGRPAHFCFIVCNICISREGP